MYMIRHDHKRVDLGFGRKQRFGHDAGHILLSTPAEARPGEIVEPFPGSEYLSRIELFSEENLFTRHSTATDGARP